MQPQDISRLRPDDRFHIHGIRLIVDRPDWPRWLRWLQHLIEQHWPPVPRGSYFTMKVNGNVMLQVPLDTPMLPLSGPSMSAAFAPKVLVLSPTDRFECGVTFSKPVRSSPVRVMLDGYLVRGVDRIAETIYAGSNPGQM